MKNIYSAVLFTFLFIFKITGSAYAAPVLIDFDGVTGEIGSFYKSSGVEFFQGNSQFGASTSITGSAYSFTLPSAAISGDNVLLPGLGSNNDILVHFYDSSENRGVANFISVRNDLEGIPNQIVLAAYDFSNTLLQQINIIGAGSIGSITVNDIWYAKIYSAPGTTGFLGVDNFEFEVAPSPVPVPSAIWLLGSCLVGLIGMRKNLKYT